MKNCVHTRRQNNVTTSWSIVSKGKEKKHVYAVDTVGIAVLQKTPQLAGVLRAGICDLQARLPGQLHAKGQAAASKGHQTRDYTWNLKILKQAIAKAVEAMQQTGMCPEKWSPRKPLYFYQPNLWSQAIKLSTFDKTYFLLSLIDWH